MFHNLNSKLLIKMNSYSEPMAKHEKTFKTQLKQTGKMHI